MLIECMVIIVGVWVFNVIWYLCVGLWCFSEFWFDILLIFVKVLL